MQKNIKVFKVFNDIKVIKVVKVVKVVSVLKDFNVAFAGFFSLTSLREFFPPPCTA